MSFLQSRKALWITAALLVLDQVTKLLVRGLTLPALGIDIEGMHYAQSVPLLGEWLKITLVENPAMAFGLEFVGKIVLASIAFIASIGIVVYNIRHATLPAMLRLGLVLVLAGALGNFIDRAFYAVLFSYGGMFQGNVVDFIDVDLFTVGSFKFWPIFNVADAAVTMGVLSLMFFNSFQKAPKAAPAVDSASATDAEEASGNGRETAQD